MSGSRRRVLVAPTRPSTGRHVIAEISYAAERIECSCGIVIVAERDIVKPDRHEPLTLAWQDHRRSAGARVISWSRAMSRHGEFA